MNNIEIMNYRRLALIAQDIKDIIGNKKLNLTSLVKLFKPMKDYILRFNKAFNNPIVYIDYNSYDGHKYSIALADYNGFYRVFSILSSIDGSFCSIEHAKAKLKELEKVS